jgi:hypothetical protein
LFSKEIYEKILKIQIGKETKAGTGNKEAVEENERRFSIGTRSANSSLENLSEQKVTGENGITVNNLDADTVVINADNLENFDNINLDDETKGLLFGNSIDQKVNKRKNLLIWIIFKHISTKKIIFLVVKLNFK